MTSLTSPGYSKGDHMIGKSLYCLAILAGALFGPSASAVTTSKNVDAGVTRGAALTTFTFVNNTGGTLPAGIPISMGQAFRYGDVMPGIYPVIRDAATHLALRGQQWDEISTWRENGGNGSWRHAVWAIWLPKNLVGGASYTVEFVLARGVYSQSSHQPLGALCKGSGAHDLKIHLGDVRNQDDTVRDGGEASFRLCDNIANVGRDAPRHLRAGNVYDEYEVRGLFTYGSSGHKDPLLYASCIVDLFTRAADGISPGDVRWVCHVHNSWMNVAAGSVGNPGAPGPAGFVGDPQAISYRPEVLDGAVSVLNWSGLDATVSSARNPVRTTGCGTDVQGTLLNCINIPSSTGANTWYYAQGTRVTCTANCVGGLMKGSLYWVYNNGSTNSNGGSTNLVTIENTPQPTQKNKVLTVSQGSGTTSFSFRVWHPHWETWQTLDTSGDENWSLEDTGDSAGVPCLHRFRAAVLGRDRAGSARRFEPEARHRPSVGLRRRPQLPPVRPLQCDWRDRRRRPPRPGSRQRIRGSSLHQGRPGELAAGAAVYAGVDLARVQHAAGRADRAHSGAQQRPSDGAGRQRLRGRLPRARRTAEPGHLACQGGLGAESTAIRRA